METCVISESSLDLACSAVYVRFKRKNGLYFCQLVFARSKVVPKGMSIPEAEVYAAVRNASTGHARSALGDYIKSRLSLTDSQIVLYWMNNSKLQLKQWLRNRIIEIHLLTKRENWYYINSKNIIADLGTKRRAKLYDISDNSICTKRRAKLSDISDNSICAKRRANLSDISDNSICAKRRAKLSDISDNSICVNGHDWAKLDEHNFLFSRLKN